MQYCISIISNHRNIDYDFIMKKIPKEVKILSHSTRTLLENLYILEISCQFDEENFILLKDIIENLSHSLKFDYGIISENITRKKRILLCDMDSTIIAHETTDELAKIIDIEEEMSYITQQTMEGKIDFDTSFQKRLRMFSGYNLSEFDSFLQSNIVYNKGAKELIEICNQNDIITVLVSGGYSFMVNRVANELNFQFAHGNEIEIQDDIITGELIGISGMRNTLAKNNISQFYYEPNILDGECKRKILHYYQDQYNIHFDETISVGDGSNDMFMILDSSLGISYFGKPILAKEANISIRYTDLRAILAFIVLK